MEDILLDSITKIANAKSVIEHCEPDVCWHQTIEKWMVERILYSVLLLSAEVEKNRKESDDIQRTAQSDGGKSETGGSNGLHKVSRKRDTTS